MTTATKDPTGFAIVEAAKAQDIERMHATLPFALPGFIDQAIQYCAEVGLMEGLQVLWEKGSSQRHLEAMGCAARKSQPEALRFILHQLGPQIDTTNALGDAIVAGSAECIALLLPGANADEAVRDLIYDEIPEVDMMAEHVAIDLVELAVGRMPDEALPAMRARLQARDLTRRLDTVELPVRGSVSGPRL